MATEDQTEGTISPNALKSGKFCSTSSPRSEMLTHLLELYTFKHDHIPKVRKPYTITKQREKWTEEEHQRFLEALRLYGRGWRQIEEHIGTKTAVQIRSHAQKFFSKVVKESNGSFESSIKPLEIPPPRPKRKPLHPYPRKSVDSLKAKGVSPTAGPERSPSPNHFVIEQDNKSLSTIVSDVMGSATSQQNGSSSPTSCITNAQSINTPPCEKENDQATSNSSAEEDKAFLSSFKVYGHSAMENILPMKIITDFKDSECTKGVATTVVPFTSIKLLGKTIQVKDSLGAENFKSPTSKAGQENNDAVVQALHPSRVSKVDTRLSIGTVVDCRRAMPHGTNSSLFMEIDQHEIDHVESTTDKRLSLWTFYQGLPFSYITSVNQTNKASCDEDRMKDKEILNERYCPGSNTGSLNHVESGEKNSDSIDSHCQHIWPEGKLESRQKCSKGFVPYKRCLGEREMSSSVVSEERERQRARACS